MYPRNEKETIDLYKSLQDELGWRIVHLQGPFPDAIIENASGKQLVVEFEYHARNFKKHGHDPKGCDLIVCWRNNFPEAPLPVWALDEDSARHADVDRFKMAYLALAKDFERRLCAMTARVEYPHNDRLKAEIESVELERTAYQKETQEAKALADYWLEQHADREEKYNELLYRQDAPTTRNDILSTLVVTSGALWAVALIVNAAVGSAVNFWALGTMTLFALLGLGIPKHKEI